LEKRPKNTLLFGVHRYSTSPEQTRGDSERHLDTAAHKPDAHASCVSHTASSASLFSSSKIFTIFMQEIKSMKEYL
jgi:hypothetical protein